MTKKKHNDEVVTKFKKLLGQYVNEVKLSPSIATAETKSSPLENENLMKSFESIKSAFSNSLMIAVIKPLMSKHYNQETREFDDQVYESVKKAVDAATDEAVNAMKDTLSSVWAKAAASTGGKQ